MLDYELTKCIFYEKKEDILANVNEYDEKKLAYELGILEGIAAVLGTKAFADLVTETEKLAAQKKYQQ